VEAKANIPEVVSPGTGAEDKRRALLEKSLAEVRASLGVNPSISWSGKFYQYANRLAHLYFLRGMESSRIESGLRTLFRGLVVVVSRGRLTSPLL
jgi:hypothetical protein